MSCRTSAPGVPLLDLEHRHAPLAVELRAAFDHALGSRQYRDFGAAGASVHALAGFNERLDGLQAALLRVKLPPVGTWIAARRAVADGYRKHLQNAGIELLEERPESLCTANSIRADRCCSRKGRLGRDDRCRADASRVTVATAALCCQRCPDWCCAGR